MGKNGRWQGGRTVCGGDGELCQQSLGSQGGSTHYQQKNSGGQSIMQCELGYAV